MDSVEKMRRPLHTCGQGLQKWSAGKNKWTTTIIKAKLEMLKIAQSINGEEIKKLQSELNFLIK